MAVNDDIIIKNPFGFQLAGVLVNDSVTREAISKEQMWKFLKLVHDDVVYCKYYEVVHILFHAGMRISEFCGLTQKDIDLEKRIINIDHQLQRTSNMWYIFETTKTDAGTRKTSITEDVAQMFQAIIGDREPPKVERVINGYSGFLFYDENNMPLVTMHWQLRFNHMVGRYNDFIACRCRILLLMYADTPIVPIWKNREWIQRRYSTSWGIRLFQSRWMYTDISDSMMLRKNWNGWKSSEKHRQRSKKEWETDVAEDV